MSRLDNLLNRYKERTDYEPSGSVEAKVLARIQARQSQFSLTLFSQPSFRALAVSIGLAIGVVVPGLTSVAKPLEDPATGLAVFSTNAPHLPTSWIGQTK